MAAPLSHRVAQRVPLVETFVISERMADFVRLFPVHAAYLDTFERVDIAGLTEGKDVKTVRAVVE